jgi:Ca2+-binding RTX toxin-like protein
MAIEYQWFGDGTDHVLDYSAEAHGYMGWLGTGDDSLIGSDFSDFINGASGNDTIDGGGSKDVIIGGQGIDVLTLQRGDEGGDQPLLQFLGDALVLPAHQGELVEGRGPGAGQGLDQDVDAFIGLAGALLQEIEEDVAAADESLE